MGDVDNMHLHGDALAVELKEALYKLQQSSNLRAREGTTIANILSTTRLTLREAFLAVFVAISIYLIAGSHAMLVCSLATSVPAAAFTYKMVTDMRTTSEGNRAILFYWTLQGFLTAFDPMFHDSFGYYVGKFTVLSAIFVHVVMQNLHVLGMEEEEGEKTAYKEPTECTQMTGIMSSARSRSQHSVFIANYMTEEQVARQLMLEGRLDGEGETEVPWTRNEVEEELRTLDVSTCSEDECVTEREETSVEKELFAFKSAPLTTIPAHAPSPFALAQSAVMTPLASSAQLCPSISQQTVAFGYGDIITNPVNSISMSRQSGECCSVMITNTTSQHLMWALKTNAIKRIVATPVCGVIESGRTIEIQVAVADEAQWSNYMGDKMAIDYLACGSNPLFDRSFLTDSNRRRHLFRINYH